MHRSESRPAGIVALTMSAFLVALAILLTTHPAAAAPTTYTVTSTQCEGTGSITEAMSKANANSGVDTITFSDDLEVDFTTCPPNPCPSADRCFALQATESVIFEGNDAKLIGSMSWISSDGSDEAGDRCPIPTDLIVAITPGFIKVGVKDQDNSAITVTVRDLYMEELGAVAQIELNASLVIEDSKFYKIWAVPSSGCTQSAVLALAGASFTAYRTEWFDIWNDAKPFLGIILNGAISGVGAGDLAIERSKFDFITKAGVVSWDAPSDRKVNIVSSRFNTTGGITFSGAATGNIVNSIWSTRDTGSGVADRIVNFSTGEMNIIASTLLFADVMCDSDCLEEAGRRGLVYRNPGAATINLIESAIGVTFPDEAGLNGFKEVLDPDTFDPSPPPFGFSADEYTWIQPTGGQDAAALKAVTGQMNLLTDPPGLPTFETVPLPVGQVARATPIVPGPGVLLDIIPDANCDFAQANALKNPIDDSCIAEDALGNPRWDGNDRRNSGAVQLTEAPHLSVIGVGDGTVDLSWTKPRDVVGLCGYRLTYRETGTTNDVPVDITDPDTLSDQVTGLTNGTEYEFEVEGLVNCPASTPSGFPSNLVTAIPQGPFNVDRNPDESAVATNKENKTRYWENIYGGTCYKYEVGDDYGSVWEITGGDPLALILKSARTNDVWDTPSPGYYGTVSLKDISHAIVCYDILPE